MTATVSEDPVRTDNDHSGFDQMARLLRHFAGWMQKRQSKIEMSYLIPERGGLGWYVVAKEPVFDFDLNRQLAEFGAELIRQGFAIHATLIPGSVTPSVPTDGIAITPSGGVTTYAN